MAQFSQATAAATCSVLFDKAQLMVGQTQVVLQAVQDDRDLRQSLAALSSRLQQLGHHVNQLGDLIADASVVHSQLGLILQSGLTEYQSALAVVSDGLDMGGDRICDMDAVTSYLSFAAASVGLFVLGAQLLTMEAEQEQQSKLANPGAIAIVDAAHGASERVLSFGYKIKN
ncbi:hypothetical protein B0I37DRAFT_743 [Chaetomium sp. MPI-CAGE-AT-0009]|nr:hypothetical protein B0I37DRAFT_743 [Chaetomium sp. MPI-CAGE-AT-0009]